MKDFLLPLHFMFMVAGAVLLLSATIIAYLKKQGWVVMHKAFALTGSLSIALAFCSVFVLKYKMHYPHFKSIHSLGGMTAICLILILLITGFLVMKGNKVSRPVHVWLGRLTALLLLGASLSGLIQFVEIMAR